MVVLTSLMAVAPAAQASKPLKDGRGSCDIEDRRRWSKLASPPDEAGALAALANAAPAFPTPQNWQTETWWAFGPAHDGRRAITGHDGWVCIAE